MHTKLDNISLGLVSIGYAWEKIDIEVDKLDQQRGSDDARGKKENITKIAKGHHEPIIKEDHFTRY